MKHQRISPRIALALGAICLQALSSCSSGNESSDSLTPSSDSSTTSKTTPSVPSSESRTSSVALPSSSSSSSSATTVIPSSSSSEPVVTHNVCFDTGDENVLVEDIEVEEGNTIDKPYPSREGYALRRWLLDGEEFDFSTPIDKSITLTAEWVERTNLPTMLIELRDGQNEVFPIDSVTREEYVSSHITLVNGEGNYDQKDTASSFKGRGNGSWLDAKKGYKIKFNKKQSLFGRTANKHWVILACTNFNDTTMLRNYSAYNMAGQLFSNLEYTTNAVWMDVFVNGEYRGVYLLCEHVRVGKGRVDISSEYGEEDTGYLIEYDAYAKGTEGIDYFDITDSGESGETGGGGSKGKPFPRRAHLDGEDPFPGGGDNPFPGGGDNPFPGGGGNPFPGGGDPAGGVDISTHPHGGIVRYNFSVHSPDPEDYAEDGSISEEQYRAQVAFIKDYVKRVYTAAISDADWATFSELANVDSLVDLYILNELYKNTDCGYSSFYMYKKAGGQLFFGPAWDFDGTTTAARGDENNPEGIYVAGTVKNVSENTSSELLIALYQIEEFRDAVNARWQTLTASIQQYYDELFTQQFYSTNRKAIAKNFVRWSSNGFGQGTLTLEQAQLNWVGNCKTLKSWFDNRIAFLNSEWAVSAS